jgi:hypothetical protein
VAAAVPCARFRLVERIASQRGTTFDSHDLGKPSQAEAVQSGYSMGFPTQYFFVSVLPTPLTVTWRPTRANP